MARARSAQRDDPDLEDEERPEEYEEDDTEDVDDREEGDEGGSAMSLADELKSVIRDAAVEVLGPAARQATTSLAKYAVKKGPELVSEKVIPAVTGDGAAGGLAETAVSKAGGMVSKLAGGDGGGLAGAAVSKAGEAVSKLAGGGGGSGGEASGWGRKRRMPVQQWIYVSVPVRHAYNGWTEYQQWPDYMHRANQVDADITDERVRLQVTEKMWGFTRPFTAEVISQRPDEHIRWKSRDGTKHAGTVNFHELGPRLTLIEVNLDHSPSGLVEKTARGARFTKRAVRADLHRFQGWIEMKSEEELEKLEGWRGTVENGEITQSHQDALEQEQQEDGEGGGEDQREASDHGGEPRAEGQSEDTEASATDSSEEETEGEDEYDADSEGEEEDETEADEEGDFDVEGSENEEADTGEGSEVVAEEDTEAEVDEDTEAAADESGQSGDSEDESDDESQAQRRPVRRRPAERPRRTRVRAEGGESQSEEPSSRPRRRSQPRQKRSNPAR